MTQRKPLKKKPTIVKVVEYIRARTGLYTYQIEFIAVLAILIAVLILNHGKLVEFIAAAAVFFSFAHMKVANRMAEREEYRLLLEPDDKITLPYFYKVKRYLYIKEFLWILYFVLIGAWSAIAGCLIFIAYGPWRKLWRTYYPLEEKLNLKDSSKDLSVNSPKDSSQ